MAQAPPQIFSTDRRKAVWKRALRVDGGAGFILEDMVEDVIERLSFLREEPASALVIGDRSGKLAGYLAAQGAAVEQAAPDRLDEELPYPGGPYGFIASLGTLATVNDLPGALIHLRNALAPGGLVIASFPGAGSLPVLRSAMIVADAERPAARIHPQVDVRSAAQLLQRAGWADPVVDSHAIRVSYRSLDRLVQDLREQGLGNVLANPGPPLGKAALARARSAFLEQADAEGRVIETFEILTLSGRRKG